MNLEECRTKMSSLSCIEIYYFNQLKEGILHNEGKFVFFLKNGQKKFPTYVEKYINFKN
jgi:hypothetical protein